MDQLIGEMVNSITETITEPSLINIDYTDIRDIMSKGGVAVMLVGERLDAEQGGERCPRVYEQPYV